MMMPRLGLVTRMVLGGVLFAGAAALTAPLVPATAGTAAEPPVLMAGQQRLIKDNDLTVLGGRGSYPWAGCELTVAPLARVSFLPCHAGQHSTYASAAAASGSAATALHDPFVRAVSCVTARKCVAVGGYQSGPRLLPLAWIWNGKGWKLQRVPLVPGDSGGLNAVSCHSLTACTAVGQSFRAVGTFVSRPLVERWNGRRWAVQRTARPFAAGGSILTGVSCTSAAACTAVGYSEFDEDEAGLPLVERWNSRRWAFQRAPGDQGDTLAAVSCASGRSCTAVGTSAQGDLSASLLAEHWNGRRWALQHTPANPPGRFSGLSGVSCPVAAACAAVGTSGNSGQPQVALAGWWKGKNWVVHRVASPAGGSLGSASCRSTRMCVAVGSYQASSLSNVPESARWNGKRWVIATLPVHFSQAPHR